MRNSAVFRSNSITDIQAIAVCRIFSFKLIFLLTLISLVTGCETAEENDAAYKNVEHGNVCIDLSPDGTAIVFSSADGDLYLFDLASKQTTQLTDTERIESCPSFSPDGKTIVFAACESNNSPYGIFLIDLNNNKLSQLTSPEEQSDFHPRYTVDGKQIVFARSYLHRRYSLGGWTWDDWDVCMMSADGTNVSRLTNEKYYQLDRIVPKSDKSVIFTAHVAADDPPYGLYSLKPSGMPELMIPNKGEAKTEVHAWATNPMLSPDEKSIVFTSDREKPFWYDVCVVSEDEDRLCLVGEQSSYNAYPDFFPDGKRIVFLAGTRHNRGSRAIYRLWEVSLDGVTSEIASDDLFTNPKKWLRKISDR